MLNKDVLESLKSDDRLKDLNTRKRIAMSWKDMLWKLKLTQKHFCEKYGYDRGLFSRWCSGKVIPEWQTIERVSDDFSTICGQNGG